MKNSNASLAAKKHLAGANLPPVGITAVSGPNKYK